MALFHISTHCEIKKLSFGKIWLNWFTRCLSAPIMGSETRANKQIINYLEALLLQEMSTGGVAIGLLIFLPPLPENR